MYVSLMHATLAPEFHVVVQEGSNGEIYNMAIRGANIGGSDGIDISGEIFLAQYRRLLTFYV